MQLKARKYVYDIQQAAELVAQFTVGKAFADYQREPMIRLAVERGFEIIGKALSQTREAGWRARRAHQRIPTHYRLPKHSHSWLRRGG